jgi:hypothetical protein
MTQTEPVEPLWGFGSFLMFPVELRIFTDFPTKIREFFDVFADL